MRPTVAYIEHRFGQLNRQCFNEQLPKVAVRLSRARTYLGQLGYKRRRLFGGMENYDFVLRISIRRDLTEDEITDTLLHEMIHLYIASHHLKDTSAHGRLFRQMMGDLNRRFGRHITISHRSTHEELDADRQQRTHLVCVSTFDNSERGITIAARSRIFQLWDLMKRFPKVTATEWYLTHDPYFNRYPRALTPKIYRIKPDELDEHLKTAQPLARQGGRIFVRRT